MIECKTPGLIQPKSLELKQTQTNLTHNTNAQYSQVNKAKADNMWTLATILQQRNRSTSIFPSSTTTLHFTITKNVKIISLTPPISNHINIIHQQ